MALKGRIVTYVNHPKRPPMKRKPVALKVPAVVAKRSRRRVRGKNETAAEVMSPPPAVLEEGAAQLSTPRAAERVAPMPSIVTIERKPGRFGGIAPDLSPDELEFRGEAAGTLWRDLVRAANDRP